MRCELYLVMVTVFVRVIRAQMDKYEVTNSKVNTTGTITAVGCNPQYNISSPSVCSCTCYSSETKNLKKPDNDDDDYDWGWWRGNVDSDSTLCVPHCSVSLSCEYPPSCREQLIQVNRTSNSKE